MEAGKAEKNPMGMTEKELYKALAARINKFRTEGNYGKSKFIPMILRKMCPPEDVRILLNLPGSPNDIAPKVNMTEADVESRLKILGQKGIAFNTRKGWFLPRHVIQLHDACLTNPNFDEEYGDEFFALWEAFSEVEWFPDPSGVLLEISAVRHGGFHELRVVPDQRALPEGQELEPYENLSTMFEQMGDEGKLGLMPCACKRARPGWPISEDIWACIVWERGYDWNEARGAAKKLTPDEMLEAINKFHDKGMVSLAPNIKGFAASKGAVQMFCNCHPEHCDVMRPAVLQGVPLHTVYEPSRYVMTVKSTSDCRACQACVDMCIFGAAQMSYDPQTGKWKAWIDTEKCMGCGNCFLVCPINNRVLKLVKPPEHVPDELPGVLPGSYANA